MKQRLLILADDLSGAADCAVPFARGGFGAEVLLQPDLVAQSEASVVAVDLNTRELTPGQAVQATARAIKLIPAASDTVWYRKIDSTLRGNVGPDVLATWRRMRHKRLILCAPAFPDTGRTTINGEVLVYGSPLGRDQKPKSLSELFTEVGLPTRLVSLEEVRSGSEQIVNHLKNHSEVTAVLFDAQTNADLSIIAQAGLELSQEIIFVGSAGLSHQIAALWAGRDECPTPPGPRNGQFPDRPILIVIGSKSSVSRAQFAHLSTASGMDLLSVSISAFQTENDPAIVSALNQALATRRDLAITTELTESISDENGGALMRSLGTTLRPFLDRFSALILTGGETARGVLVQSQICHLRMLNELEAGVTLSISVSKPELPIVIKAGSFGTPATLMNALEFLRSRRK